MTRKERFTAALERRTPDRVPTFELEYQLEEEMFGRAFDYSSVKKKALAELSPDEKDKRFHILAEHTAKLYLEKLDYDCIPVSVDMRFEDKLDYIRVLKKTVGEDACIHHHGDGTFSIPDGDEMYEFAYRVADDWDGLIAEADAKASYVIERNKRLSDAGVDVFILCSDYCYNSGPFISPDMFSKLITPYLARIIEGIRSEGRYAIKHTDGNIMPIIDQLVGANPHALHSLDPMAGVDIKKVKELYGARVALCGNVNCALMQTGTDAQVAESARYCMTYGKPGGGYIFSTSNVPFKGLDPERYRMILDIWKSMRDY